MDKRISQLRDDYYSIRVLNIDLGVDPESIEKEAEHLHSLHQIDDESYNLLSHFFEKIKLEMSS